MKYKNLGNTDLKVSSLCLGSMQFGWTADEALSLRILSEAYHSGINFIDTANIYSRWAEGNPGGVSERIIGNWLKENKIPREKIVLATKVRGNMGAGKQDEGLSRQHIMKAVEDSLRRLQTDYIDLYQAHWPDDATPIEETLSALDDLVKQGKVRFIGASNYPAWKLMQALWTADKAGLARFDTLQPHFNLVHREEFERDLAEVCHIYQIAVIPYSPLAGGFLTGKYQPNLLPNSARVPGVKQYFTEQNWALLDLMAVIAKRKGAHVSQIALAWLISNPLVASPIIDVNSVEQLKDNLGALKVTLTQEEVHKLDQASRWRAADS
ncbi:MAG: aldo/keto reductase [Chloroflexota bacterium]